MANRKEYARAKARGTQRRGQEPYAVDARYDDRQERILVDLNTGLTVVFPPSMVEGLAAARPCDLRDIEITPSGFGLHFPRLDADIYLPGLLAGTLGSRRWLAAPGSPSRLKQHR